MAFIYHMAPRERWQNWPAGEAYLPAEFAADGFVHCTGSDELMLQVANRFYCSELGDFVLLTIEPQLLTAPLLWEKPDDDLASVFPHVYGPLDRAAIVGVRAMVRDTSGDFIGIVDPAVA